MNNWWVEVIVKGDKVRNGPSSKERARQRFAWETEYGCAEGVLQVNLREGDDGRDGSAPGPIRDACFPACDTCAARGRTSHDCQIAIRERERITTT